LLKGCQILAYPGVFVMEKMSKKGGGILKFSQVFPIRDVSIGFTEPKKRDSK
jgi:hypothetical protein